MLEGQGLNAENINHFQKTFENIELEIFQFLKTAFINISFCINVIT